MHKNWIRNEMYRRPSHLHPLDFSSLRLSHTCSQCTACRAQWKHCYPKCIYHLVWLLRLLANTRKLGAISLRYCSASKCNHTHIQCLRIQCVNWWSVLCLSHEEDMSAFSLIHGFHHLIDTIKWTSPTVPKSNDTVEELVFFTAL